MDSDKITQQFIAGEKTVVLSTDGDPLTEMAVTGSTIAAAAKDPRAIGRLLVDMVYSEGADPAGHALYFEHKDNKRRLLTDWETGMEAFTTGGWVRCVTASHIYRQERAGIKQQAAIGRAVDHGTYRDVRMIEFR